MSTAGLRREEGTVTADSSAEIRHGLSDEQRAQYFATRKREQRKLGKLLLQKLQEMPTSGVPPRRILVETAVETGYPIDVVQRVLWTLETRGQIQWQHGRFHPVKEPD
jgi:hypothetical protein